MTYKLLLKYETLQGLRYVLRKHAECVSELIPQCEGEPMTLKSHANTLTIIAKIMKAIDIAPEVDEDAKEES